MKRLIFAVAAILMFAAPAVQAQKINKEAFTERIIKSDTDVKDAKKGVKASTWMNRGKVYFEALEAPTKNNAEGVDQQYFEMIIGSKPKQTGTETVSGVQMTTLVYPYFTAYVHNGQVIGWKQTREIQRGLFGQVLASYNKAYELDPKVKDKVRAELDKLINYCIKSANISIGIEDYEAAANGFAQAYEAQTSPVYEKADPINLFYAGRLYTIVAGQNNNDVEMFKKAAPYLEKALAEGYCDEEGSLYYYLFHCYYGQRAEDKEFIIKSRDVLLEGISKYPKNELILDGLMNLYTVEEGVGDPQDLVGMIDSALAEDADNIDLWYGRGRVFFKLKNYDECIKSFNEVIRLRPDDSQSHYLQGVFYLSKADELMDEINNVRSYTTQAEYDKDCEEALVLYRAAIPFFEKAIELNPNDMNSIDFVKSIYFRLRDEGDNMAKYSYYNEMLNQLKAQQ